MSGSTQPSRSCARGDSAYDRSSATWAGGASLCSSSPWRRWLDGGAGIVHGSCHSHRRPRTSRPSSSGAWRSERPLPFHRPSTTYERSTSRYCRNAAGRTVVRKQRHVVATWRTHRAGQGIKLTFTGRRMTRTGVAQPLRSGRPRAQAGPWSRFSRRTRRGNMSTRERRRL